MTTARIDNVVAREVLDSRGQPTVEVDVHATSGTWGRAIVPSGASTGSHEARELRDGDSDRYEGNGVRRAVANVNNVLGPALRGFDITVQPEIDKLMRELDGTPDKSRLGANAILGISMATSRAAAATMGLPLFVYLDWHNRRTLPLPMVNMISGGLHAGGQLALQDFLLMPVGAVSYREALEQAVKVYRALGRRLTKMGYEGVLVGDEGGYGPKLPDNAAAIEALVGAIEDAGLQPGQDAAIALDVAATHFHQDGHYVLDGKRFRPSDVVDLLAAWVERYPILSIEDGLAEDDWDGWVELTRRLGDKVQLVGDDLFVTHPDRLRRGQEAGVANAILIKVNQIGTLTEALEVVQQARQGGYAAVISARSGETEDSFLADFAVATGAGQIKIGSVARSERLAKYNQLLRIEQLMGQHATYAGRMRLAPVLATA